MAVNSCRSVPVSVLILCSVIPYQIILSAFCTPYCKTYTLKIPCCCSIQCLQSKIPFFAIAGFCTNFYLRHLHPKCSGCNCSFISISPCNICMNMIFSRQTMIRKWYCCFPHAWLNLNGIVPDNVFLLRVTPCGKLHSYNFIRHISE